MASDTGGNTAADRTSGFDPTAPAGTLASLRFLAHVAKFAYGRADADGAVLRAAGFATALPSYRPGMAEPVAAGVFIDAAELDAGTGAAAATSTQLYLLCRERTVILAFRGSEPKPDDWLVDFDAGQCDAPTGGRLHRGFRAALDAVWEPLRQQLAALDPEHLWITGHSLGGALAVLAAYRLCVDDAAGAGHGNVGFRSVLRGVVSFGQPRVGDWEFASECERLPLFGEDRTLGLNTFRVVTKDDIVPRIPPPQLGFRHFGRVLYIAGDGSLAEVDGEDEVLVDRLAVKLEALRRGRFSAVTSHDMAGYVAALDDPRNAAFRPRSLACVTATQVLRQERKCFEALRPGSTGHSGFPVGLALSGGGIRSATFNLGLLQALARSRLLQHVDYLSTVSGGGYIGAWLSAWSQRLQASGGQLDGGADADDRFGDSGEPEPVTWLRRFSNYLTPRTGPFSADTLTGAATWLRNTLLNQALLAAVIAVVILLAWVVVTLLDVYELLPFELLVIGAVLAGMGVRQGLAEATAADSGREGSRTDSNLAVGVLAAAGLALPVPLLAASGLDLAGHRLLNAVVWAPPLGILAFFAIATAIIALCSPLGGEQSREWWSRACGRWMHVALIWLVVMAMALYAPFVAMWLKDEYVAIGGMTWALTTAAGLLSALSVRTGEGQQGGWRDLAARLAPYLFITGLVGLVSMGVHKGLERLSAYQPAAERQTCQTPPATPGWETSHRLVGDPNATLLQQKVTGNGCSYERYAASNLYVIAGIDAGAWLLIGLGCVVAIGGLGYFVDVNRFSFHFYYRNRLERCYLGASNRRRRPNRYTGLDPDDSPLLDDLAGVRPYPLINTCLNLTYDPGSDRHGDQLGWQERKGASFLFSPLYCGYRLAFGARGVNAYQPTAVFSSRARLFGYLDRLQRAVTGAAAAGSLRGRFGGAIRHLAEIARRKSSVSLGMAMTISGAAASPNWGYHSSPATAFLMTVFNARLGWWLQNPRQPRWWQGGEPGFSALLLLQELLGRSSDRHEYVYLSDGGHFENLGIYELVRRRCKVIIASDAGADGSYGFEDLGNAVRKCRTDFGVEIEIDPRAIIPGDNGLSQHHCAVGIIRYPETADLPASQGQLLYIKSSLTGDEPADLLQYKAKCPDFPQQSTLDQWFDESQFESYRKLGEQIGDIVIGAEYRRMRLPAGAAPDFVALLDRLWRRWHRPCPYIDLATTRHGGVLENLLAEMRDKPSLAPLDAQLNADWTVAVPDAGAADAFEPTREIMYFCVSLFQLMQDVYSDLHLEEEHAHPDVQGWMNVFRQWARADLVLLAWAIFGAGLGRRFRDFCLMRLGFPEAEVVLDRQIPNALPPALAAAGQAWHDEQVAARRQRHGDRPVELRLFTMVVGRHRLPFGYAVVGRHEPREMLFDFWIRPHLRGLGLGRRAALALRRDYPGLAYGKGIGGEQGRALRDVLRSAGIFEGG